MILFQCDNCGVQAQTKPLSIRRPDDWEGWDTDRCGECVKVAKDGMQKALDARRKGGKAGDAGVAERFFRTLS